jgi:hypothetical protein
MRSKTFICSVRCDLIDIAKVAVFMERRGIRMEGNQSRSRIPSMTVGIVAELSDIEIDSTEEAIKILRNLGYDDSIKQGRKDYKPILKQLSLESSRLESGSSTIDRVRELMTNRQQVTSNIKDIRKYLDNVDDAPLTEKDI